MSDGQAAALPCQLRDCRAPASYAVTLVLADEAAARVLVCADHAEQIMGMRWGLSIEGWQSPNTTTAGAEGS